MQYLQIHPAVVFSILNLIFLGLYPAVLAVTESLPVFVVHVVVVVVVPFPELLVVAT